MIGRRLRRSLGELIAGVIVGSQGKFIERGKKMVVPRLLSRVPVTHRPRIDHRVVQNVVAISAADLGSAVRFAGRVTRRSAQPRGGAVHAKSIFGGEVDPALSVDGARKVVVQVTP